MVNNINLTAANAYRNQLKLMQDTKEGAPQSDALQPSFSQLLQNAAENTVDAAQSSEALQLQSLTGNVDLAELVTAVSNAELTLDTVVAVRDRVINAYNDILKMPI